MAQQTELVSNQERGAELVWVKPKRSRLQFELRAGDTVVATLAWARGSQALGQWGAVAYRFSRQGWLRPRVFVRLAEAPEASEPRVTFAARHGALTFPDGRAFFWQRPRRVSRERVWVEGGGTECIRFRPEKRGTVVSTPQAADRQPELPLLVLLGQYLIVLAAQDTEAATLAAVVATIGSGG